MGSGEGPGVDNLVAVGIDYFDGLTGFDVYCTLLQVGMTVGVGILTIEQVEGFRDCLSLMNYII